MRVRWFSILKIFGFSRINFKCSIKIFRPKFFRCKTFSLKWFAVPYPLLWKKSSSKNSSWPFGIFGFHKKGIEKILLGLSSKVFEYSRGHNENTQQVFLKIFSFLWNVGGITRSFVVGLLKKLCSGTKDISNILASAKKVLFYVEIVLLHNAKNIPGRNFDVLKTFGSLGNSIIILSRKFFSEKFFQEYT